MLENDKFHLQEVENFSGLKNHVQIEVTNSLTSSLCILK